MHLSQSFAKNKEFEAETGAKLKEINIFKNLSEDSSEESPNITWNPHQQLLEQLWQYIL